METVTDKRGRTYERQRRPLSNTSINAMITLLGQILQQARGLRADRPQPGAGRRPLGAIPQARPAEPHVPRGRRVPRAARCRGRARGGGSQRLQGPRAARDGGDARPGRPADQRDGRPARRAGRSARAAASSWPTRRPRPACERSRSRSTSATSCSSYVMDRRARELPMAPSDHFFGTATGSRRDPDRFRDRILARAVERASSNSRRAGLPPLPPITPHSLRRTWATFAAMIGRDPKWIAAQIGHVRARRSPSRSTSRSRPAGTSMSRPSGR